MNNSKRSGAESVPQDEQNEASFSSPSAPRSEGGICRFLLMLKIAKNVCSNINIKTDRPKWDG